jgi:hypothetical protein
VPEELDDRYEVRVKLSGGPFAIDASRPTVFRKAELTPAKN